MRFDVLGVLREHLRMILLLPIVLPTGHCRGDHSLRAASLQAHQLSLALQLNLLTC